MTRQELAKALKDAAKAGDVGAIRAALAAGADLNDPGQPGEKSALYLAAEGGHLLAVQYLCQCGADPDYVSAFGKMPVLAAVKKRSLPVVQYLLPYSAESLRITILGGMGLIECALSRTPEAATIARTLLAAGIHPDSDSAPMTGSGIMEGCCLGETAPLFYACFRHNALVAAALLEGGADPNYEGIAGGPSNPLEAVFWPNNPVWRTGSSASRAQSRAQSRAARVAEMLLQAGARPTGQAIEWASRARCSETVKAMRATRRQSRRFFSSETP